MLKVKITIADYIWHQRIDFVFLQTGVAAIQVGGKTLHSFAGIGLGNGTADSLLQMVKRGRKKVNWYEKIVYNDI